MMLLAPLTVIYSKKLMVPYSMQCSPQINLTEFHWLLCGIINDLDSNQSFTNAINKYPNLKCIFSEPPTLSFR